MEVTLLQSPDHVAHVGDTVILDGEPYVIRGVVPVKHEPHFLDWGQEVRASRVVVTLERFDGNPA